MSEKLATLGELLKEVSEMVGEDSPIAIIKGEPCVDFKKAPPTYLMERMKANQRFLERLLLEFAYLATALANPDDSYLFEKLKNREIIFGTKDTESGKALAEKLGKNIDNLANALHLAFQEISPDVGFAVKTSHTDEETDEVGYPERVFVAPGGNA